MYLYTVSECKSSCIVAELAWSHTQSTHHELIMYRQVATGSTTLVTVASTLGLTLNGWYHEWSRQLTRQLVSLTDCGFRGSVGRQSCVTSVIKLHSNSFVFVSRLRVSTGFLAGQSRQLSRSNPAGVIPAGVTPVSVLVSLCRS